jgi:pimeloyl-ACP methyl ester carboxylesterase
MLPADQSGSQTLRAAAIHGANGEALPPDPDARPESMVVQMGSGERIHYLDWGVPPNPAPTMLLLHGIASTGWSWAPVARRLCGGLRVLAPDLRGHGLSEGARSGLDLDSLAWDALTVLAANGAGMEAVGPPAIIAGHGLGAMVAATAARIQPASVAGIALVDGGWEDLAVSTRLSPQEFLAALAEPPEVMASMDVFLADRRDFDPASWDADQQRAARAQVDQKHAGHVSLITRQATLRGLAEAMFSYRPMETLSATAVQLLILVAGAGTADDETARERELALEDVLAARRAADLPDARVVRLPGTGHNLMRYRPAEVSAELLALSRDAGARM